MSLSEHNIMSIQAQYKFFTMGILGAGGGQFLTLKTRIPGGPGTFHERQREHLDFALFFDDIKQTMQIFAKFQIKRQVMEYFTPNNPSYLC